VRRTSAFGQAWVVRLLMAAIVMAVLAPKAGEHAESAPTSSAKRLRVGLVTTSSGVADPFARAAIEGLRRAVRHLDVTAQVRTPTPREGYSASLSEFAKLGYDLVISVGIPQVGIRPDRVARRFPRVRFASLDNPRGNYPEPPRNLTGIVFAREEAGYLAGYLAGLVEQRRRRPHVISAVGGIPVPGVDLYIAGYRAGARRADSRIRVLYGYSDSFTAPEACSAVASRQIAKGSGVVFSVAGGCGRGTLLAAKRNGVWGVGVDVDQASIGRHILTSAVLRVDKAVFKTVHALQQNRYRQGSDIVMGVRQEAVGLGRISPRVPRALIRRVTRVRRLIAAGVIHVPTTLGP
jgi:basic membrane protein A and related proteins